MTSMHPDTAQPPAEALLDTLRAAVPGGEVKDRNIDRIAYGSDASHYALVPRAVVVARDSADVASLFRASAAAGVPLTFRSGGTSLSGQGVTDGILVDTRRHFRSVDVIDGGARVRVQPGVTVRQVNARLAPLGYRLGPDPASETACTIGGVIANNSSGMSCGTEFNTYRTIQSMVFVLPSGAVIDSAAPDADAHLHAREPDLHEGLLRLAAQVKADPDAVHTIESQFSMKNTMGYGLNALLDYERAIDILVHLIVGSEGTLAHVAEATFETVPVLPHAATGLLIFPELRAATDALEALRDSGAVTLELLDQASLRVAQSDPTVDPLLRSLTIDRHAALLVEYQEASAEALMRRRARADPVIGGLALAKPADVSSDAAARGRLWRLRKGLYAAVAGNRPPGTTALLEDIAVPVRALSRTCEELTALLARRGYEGSVIFGHARDGNIHFMLTERFAERGQVDRYARFTEEMVDLVLAEGGTLKAEHGTGRVMAPYVRRQYGDALYEVMREIKRLCDPAGLLNPGVVISDDPQTHLRHLKVTPTVDPQIDRCVECGYCEPVCPSRDLTTTPRQRITLLRAINTARATDPALTAELERDYGYAGIDTCAADGMCQTSCPVSINTGDVVKRLRAQRTGPGEQWAWRTAARHWHGATRAAASALTLASRLPGVSTRASRAGRALLGADTVPLWTSDLPSGGQRRPAASAPLHASAVFFAACIGSIFGPADGAQGAARAFLSLCRKAGVEVVVPAGLDALCCATPWQSKGFTDGYEQMRARVVPVLLAASRNGELPIVCDASSCTEGLAQLLSDPAGHGQLGVIDAVSFVHAQLLPRLAVTSRLDSVALHPTCSSTRLAINDTLSRLANVIAVKVRVSEDWSCCAFAGDRGLLHPELTASATASEADDVAGTPSVAYVSCNRTCEVGMSRAVGRTYRHLIELVDEVTAPRSEVQ
ncbi:FAD-binding and (Fe-S)-binding domain-containing protein [Micromonospora sp. NPDC005161]